MKTNNKVVPAYLWAITFLVLNFYDLNAQTQTARYQSMISNSNAFYEYLPEGYDRESQTYPLLVFLTGIGELGDGSASSLPTVLRNGPPKLINEGTFPSSFTVDGQVFKFIVISPQFKNWPVPDDIQGVIDYAVKNYRVNTSRIYLSGLSMGGGATWDYSSYKADYANRVAAIVPVCGASSPTADKVQLIVSANLPVWATHNQDDPTVPVSNTISYVDDIDAASPTPAIPARKTIFPVSGHDAWTATYDPAFKENNLNVYEWMLQYQRGYQRMSNQLPFSNAGNDITITLPDNSVTLSGGAGDNDGSITSYSWTKISGPSEFSINNSNINNPTISNLVAGDYTLRLTVTDNNGATAYDDLNISEKSFSDPALLIPGRIEAENYSAMYGIQTENTSDEGAGKNVGWLDSGDWMDYNVKVATAGNYTVNFRLACSYVDQQLQLQNASGTVMATINVPQTGGPQNWTTVKATVSMQEGNQTLRIYSSAGSWNINWVEFISTSEVSIPGKIEAENYNGMNGILTEKTSDEGGGKNVGWFDTGDWLEYNVNVSSPGDYTVNLRLASNYDWQQLQLTNSSGNVLTTINVPRTGGYQNWTTVRATIPLPAGSQKFRIYSSSGSWNINWLEFVSAGTSANANSFLPGISAPAILEENKPSSNKTTLSLYPNPATDNLALQLDNHHLGTVNIQVVDPSGKIIKRFRFDKKQPLSRFNLSVNELFPGLYFVNIQVGEWSDSRKLIKR